MLMNAPVLQAIVETLDGLTREEKARLHTFLSLAETEPDAPNQVTKETRLKFGLRSPRISKAVPDIITQAYAMLCVSPVIRIISYATHPDLRYVLHQSDSKHFVSCMASGVVPGASKGCYHNSSIEHDYEDYKNGHLILAVVGNSWHEDYAEKKEKAEGYKVRFKLRTIRKNTDEGRYIVGFSVDRGYGQTNLIRTNYSDLLFALRQQYGQHIELYTNSGSYRSSGKRVQAVGTVVANGYLDNEYYDDDGDGYHNLYRYSKSALDLTSWYTCRTKEGSTDKNSVYTEPTIARLKATIMSSEIRLRPKDYDSAEPYHGSYFISSYYYQDCAKVNKKGTTKSMQEVAWVIKKFGGKLNTYSRAMYCQMPDGYQMSLDLCNKGNDWRLEAEYFEVTRDSTVVTRTNIEAGYIPAVRLEARHSDEEKVMYQGGIEVADVLESIYGVSFDTYGQSLLTEMPFAKPYIRGTTEVSVQLYWNSYKVATDHITASRYLLTGKPSHNRFGLFVIKDEPSLGLYKAESISEYHRNRRYEQRKSAEEEYDIYWGWEAPSTRAMPRMPGHW